MPSPTRTQQMIDTSLVSIQAIVAGIAGLAASVLFVDNSHDDAGDTASNGSASAPYETLAYAVSQAAAGDNIVMAAGHFEIIASSVVLGSSLIGVKLIGIGLPTLVVNGNVDLLDIQAAHATISGIRFNAGTAAHTARINIKETNATVERCVFFCAANDLFSITIEDAGDYAIIRDCDFTITANGPDAAVHIESASTVGTRIERCRGMGGSTTNQWDLGFIYSTVAHTQCLITDIENHFGPCVIFTAAATGLIQRVRAYGVGVTHSTFIDPGSCQCDDVKVGAQIDEQLQQFPNVTSIGRRAVKSITAANGEVTMFNVAGGEVIIRAIYGKVTTAIGATPANLKLVANPTETGSSLDLCTAVAVASDAVGVLYSCDGTVGNALDVDKIGAVATLARPFVVATGAIACNFSAAPGSGVIEWTVMWEPLTPGATVIAA